MALRRYTLKQLDAFCQVAEALSFTAAGARIGLTPSAISQLVGELESAVGFRLFERSTRRVSLTAAGKEFLPSAESVLRHATLAERAAVLPPCRIFLSHATSDIRANRQNVILSACGACCGRFSPGAQR